MRVGIISGSRADFGLLLPVIKKLKKDKFFDEYLIATGSHFSFEHGNTYKEIEKSGLNITHKVDLEIVSNASLDVAKSFSLAVSKFTKILENEKFDIILVLGDRYEIFAATIAATLTNTLVAHIHGGEVTEGSIDESFRHSITKMSHIHLTATEKSKERVIRMGENPSLTFNVGALGIDDIENIPYPKNKIEEKFNIKFLPNIILVTVHPVTNQISEFLAEYRVLLDHLRLKKDTTIVFTGANADKGGNEINLETKRFVNSKNNAYFVPSLGRDYFLSLLPHLAVMVGNSSSGIIEAPSFKIPTINIGNRQKGRDQSSSVIQCKFETASLIKAFDKIKNKNFIDSLQGTINVYGAGMASDKILNIFKELNFNKQELLSKSFFDEHDK
ncbi:UDP-N-acetylglucosamine 2-epimerase [Gammaproteobacteria bacterium]|nr:UDP-N-acetylglucosamine 2-epimerase [Gammaproteobacteria bacterium]